MDAKISTVGGFGIARTRWVMAAVAPSGAAAAKGPTCKTFTASVSVSPALPKIGSSAIVTATVKTTGKIGGCTGRASPTRATLGRTRTRATAPRSPASVRAASRHPSTTITWNNDQTSTILTTTKLLSKPGVQPASIQLHDRDHQGPVQGYEERVEGEGDKRLKGACISKPLGSFKLTGTGSSGLSSNQHVLSIDHWAWGPTLGVGPFLLLFAQMVVRCGPGAHTSTARHNDALRLDDVPIPVPDPGEVLVKVEGIPFNLNDLERINGGNMMVRPELPVLPGHGGHGRRRRVRPGAEAWLGQRVVATTKAPSAATPSTRSARRVATFEMPDDIPMPDAAALYFPFHLAWLGLFDRADLQAGETVLIHAAAGGSGSAAVQLAAHAARTVIATAGSDEKVQLCKSLGADVAINYSDDRLRSTSCWRRPATGRRRRVRQRRRGGVGAVDAVHGLQRSLPADGLRVEQGRGRRAVHRAAPRRSGTSSCAVSARLRATRDVGVRQDRDGLELRIRGAREAEKRETWSWCSRAAISR